MKSGKLELSEMAKGSYLFLSPNPPTTFSVNNSEHLPNEVMKHKKIPTFILLISYPTLLIVKFV